MHDLVRGVIFPSNVFSFSFQSNTVPVRKIVPDSYREAVDYLEAKRGREKLARVLLEAEQTGSPATITLATQPEVVTEAAVSKPAVPTLTDA